MNKNLKLIQKIEQLDSKGSKNEFNKNIKQVVMKAVSENRPLTFISFTCSTINSKYMFSDTPWLYVSTNPVGNNLTPDISRLQQIMKELRVIYPKIDLKIMIGNTDPYYIYLRQFKDFPDQKDILWKKFNERWEKYKGRLENWISKTAPTMDAQIVSWYRFEKDIEEKTGRSFETEYEMVKKNIYSYFNKSQLDWELRKLKTQFGKNAYFGYLKKPDDTLLKDWVIRKFTEYALQARWMYDNIPNIILIQNEKPSDLRSVMYQPVIQKEYGSALPIVYFLGVDNAGYQ